MRQILRQRVAEMALPLQCFTECYVVRDEQCNKDGTVCWRKRMCAFLSVQNWVCAGESTSTLVI